MTDAHPTILVTGSTDGVGRLVARKLAAGGAHVLVHGRNRERAETLVKELRAAGGLATPYLADLAALDEVRGLAEAIKRDHERLEGLVNNAGIGTGAPGAKREVSRDGYELRFAVNYLAAFLLTRLLLPLLVASRPARIVNVSSIGQQAIDFDDVMLTRGYSGSRAYCQSKLAEVALTFDLAQELAGSVTVNCLHPATYMDTTMVRNAGITPRSSVDEGAEAILRLVTSPELGDKTGLFFDGLRPSRALDQAYDAVARERLRRLSFELVGLPAPPR
jgi:NAD(P)-dependent dehydrogenase (short-subunit alcohol dehydrogenase family)